MKNPKPSFAPFALSGSSSHYFVFRKLYSTQTPLIWQQMRCAAIKLCTSVRILDYCCPLRFRLIAEKPVRSLRWQPNPSSLPLTKDDRVTLLEFPLLLLNPLLIIVALRTRVVAHKALLNNPPDIRQVCSQLIRILHCCCLRISHKGCLQIKVPHAETAGKLWLASKEYAVRRPPVCSADCKA